MSEVTHSRRDSLNHFTLPGDDNSKKPRSYLFEKLLNTDFFTKLWGAIVYRRQQEKMLFSTEVVVITQSLSINEAAPYRDTKSTLPQRLDKYITPVASPLSAIIVQISPLMRNSYDATPF